MTQVRGFALVSAIFLLVVLAAMGAYMITISGTQHFTALGALQGARAYHAARSGLELGIAKALAANGCGGFPVTVNFGSGGLAGYSAAVRCEVSNHYERGSNFNVYIIEADGYTTGGALGQPGYAWRRMRVTVTDAP